MVTLIRHQLYHSQKDGNTPPSSPPKKKIIIIYFIVSLWICFFPINPNIWTVGGKGWGELFSFIAWVSIIKGGGCYSPISYSPRSCLECYSTVLGHAWSIMLQSYVMPGVLCFSPMSCLEYYVTVLGHAVLGHAVMECYIIVLGHAGSVMLQA